MNQRPRANDLSFRFYVESDREPLIALWVASWQETMPAIDFSARRPWFAAHLKNLDATGFETVCVFDPANNLLGFVILNSRTHELDQLAVVPAAWGKGVAEELLTETRRLSPNRLVLNVNADNPRAIRFYEREGFMLIGEGVNATSGLKTLRMQWNLNRHIPSSGN